MLTSSTLQTSINPGKSFGSNRPLKQGWILKKGGSGVLAPWRPKYLALVAQGGKLTLNLYDSIDNTAAKHEIDTSNMRIEVKPAKGFALLSRNAVPFTIYTRSRKVFPTSLLHPTYLLEDI